MKVWLLLSRFELGGLERVQINLAPALVRAGLDVWIVAGRFSDGAAAMFSHPIHRLEIASSGKHAFVYGLLKNLFIHKPKVVLTTSNDVACLILMMRPMFFPNMRVICTQHLSISAPLQDAEGLEKFKLEIQIRMMRYLLPRSDGVVAVSEELSNDMREVLGLKDKIHVIHNPILTPDFSRNMNEMIDWPWVDQSLPTIVFVGRLVKVKRLDLLLEAFLQVTRKKEARLLVVGEGPEKFSILEFIARHKLHALCRLVGHQANPLPWIKASDVLVLSSDYEGFGNVLVEAMGCGIQVISTNCPDGPAEILGGGRYGQLVPCNSPEALAYAMNRALSKDFVVPASELVGRAADFGLDRASSAYLALIQNAVYR